MILLFSMLEKTGKIRLGELIKIMKHIVSVIVLLLFFGCNNSKENKESSNDTSTALSATDKVFPNLETNRYNVAFLIMDGTFNTELTAPFDIFQHTIFRDSIKAMNVFTVANTDDPITTFEGMRLIPDYNYVTDSLPKIDILVVPSA